MERIKNEEGKKMEITFSPRVILPKTHTQIINGILIFLIAIIFTALLSTYFVKDLPSVVIDIRNITKQALWVFISSYAIGELCKYVFINRARMSEEYTKAKEDAKKTLSTLNKTVSREDINKYCSDYSDIVFETQRKTILSREKISFDEYMTKYVSLSKREIKAAYPDCELSKRQFSAIRRANKVKKPIYSADFLMDCAGSDMLSVPSKMYNTKKRNFKNTASSVLCGLVGSVFAVTFAGDLIFNFSLEVIISAIVKIVILAVTIALKINFANSLVMETEIGRFNLQAIEAENCMIFHKKEKEEKVEEESKEE